MKYTGDYIVNYMKHGLLELSLISILCLWLEVVFNLKKRFPDIGA